MRLSFPRSKKSSLSVAGLAALAVIVPTAVVLAQPAASTGTAVTTATAANTGAVRVAPAADPGKLLTASDLGAGWTEVSADQMQGAAANLRGKPTGLSVSPKSCVRGMSIPKGYSGEVHRVFKQGSAMYGPYLGTAIAVFTTPKAARKALTAGITRARACQKFRVSAEFGSVDGAMSNLRIAKLGDQRVGFSIDATALGFVPVQGQVIVVRKGNAILAVGQGGIGVDTTASTKAAAALAASRL
ncbi:MAG: hypothetical protein WCP28_05345 [Actinomycetes bacterium]